MIRRNKHFRKAKRNFRVERKTEKTNGSRIAEFTNGDVDGRLKREEREGFHRSCVKGTSNASQAFVLDNLQVFHQSDTGSGGTIPELATVSHHRDNTRFEEQAEVLGSHAHDSVSQTGKT